MDGVVVVVDEVGGVGEVGVDDVDEDFDLNTLTLL